MSGNKPKAIEDMTAAELRAGLDIVSKEAYDAERKVESLLRNRAQWQRDAAAAIRRSEWEKVATYGASAARARAREMVQPVEGVLYRVEQLGERASPKQVTALKQAVSDTRFMLKTFAGEEATDFASEAEAEVARLRAFVIEQGRALHRDVSVGDRPCRCRGCELIRAMDAAAPSVRKVIDS